MKASFDPVARKVMHAVFHYISVDFVAATVVLLVAGFGWLEKDATLLVQFVAIHFALYTLVQLLIAATSGIKRAPFKLFQWTLFLPIAVLAFIGTL